MERDTYTHTHTHTHITNLRITSFHKEVKFNEMKLDWTRSPLSLGPVGSVKRDEDLTNGKCHSC